MKSDRGHKVREIANRLGRNHWLICIELFILTSLFIYVKATNHFVLQTMIVPYLVVAFFAVYDMLCIMLKRVLIFHSMPRGFPADAPLRPHWKRWFFLLYTPHLVYSLRFGAFLTVHGAPVGLLFTVGMCFLLYCAYLRLSAADEVSPPPVDKDGTAEP